MSKCSTAVWIFILSWPKMSIATQIWVHDSNRKVLLPSGLIKNLIFSWESGAAFYVLFRATFSPQPMSCCILFFSFHAHPASWTRRAKLRSRTAMPHSLSLHTLTYMRASAFTLVHITERMYENAAPPLAQYQPHFNLITKLGVAESGNDKWIIKCIICRCDIKWHRVCCQSKWKFCIFICFCIGWLIAMSLTGH